MNPNNGDRANIAKSGLKNPFRKYKFMIISMQLKKVTDASEIDCPIVNKMKHE